MVDSTEALESNFLTVAVVKSSPTKKMVVIDPGKYEEEKNGETKLSLIVNIDGKKKKWRPNRDSVQNMRVLGKDTTSWVGIPINIDIKIINGRDMVIATPGAKDDKPKVEIVQEKVEEK